MPDATHPGRIIPVLRYRDAPRAIRWLGDAFDFRPQMIVPGDRNTIAHAQLTLGPAEGRGGMIMVSTAAETEYGRWLTQPDRNAGKVTQGLYIVVQDIEGHYARAQAAGAQIVVHLKERDYGGKDYTCRDPEGHLWSFGSYDPWTQV